jgi:hypothetical protein
MVPAEKRCHMRAPTHTTHPPTPTPARSSAVVKTRLQQQEGKTTKASKYRGSVHCATTVVKEEGVAALWRGVVPTIVRNGSNSACNFGTMAFLSTHWLHKRAGDGQQVGRARACSVRVVCGSLCASGWKASRHYMCVHVVVNSSV